MTRKISSYQKLKDENTELRKDIYDLVCRRDSLAGIEVNARWDMIFRMESAIWSGRCSFDFTEENKGLLTFLTSR